MRLAVSQPVRLLITDLDDTLYDWLGFYVPSFLAMIQEISRITGVDADRLKASFQKVHRRHGTTEYAFAIQELDVLENQDGGLSPTERFGKYESAIHAFRSARRRTLRLFPGVRETLHTLKKRGTVLVAISDSMMSYVSRRMRQLEIDTLFDAICAPKDHGVPAHIPADLVRRAPLEDVVARTVHVETPAELRKPDPRLIRPALSMFGIEAEEVVLVGDSLSRDVLLARRAGVRDVWARYGQNHDPDQYEELLKITYWSQSEIDEEARLRREVEGSPPTDVIDRFPDLLAVCGQ